MLRPPFRSLLRPLIVASLGLALALPAHAAPDGGKSAGKRLSAAEEAERITRAGQADLLGRTVFQVLVGEIALQRGQTDLALNAYVDLARRTRDPKVLARATEIAIFARQYEGALELTRTWTDIEPDSPQARQTLATILVLLNRVDELAPQISALLAQDKPNLGDNLLRLNRMLSRHGDKQAVQRLVDKVAEPYQGVAEAHYAMATAAANANDNLRASLESSRALELRPDWEMAALLQAQILARSSTAIAIPPLSRFVEANPQSKDARLTLARLYIAEKRYDESRQQFERLLKDNPNNPEVIYPVAMLALQQNDLETGKAQLEKLLSTDFPDRSTVHFFLGQVEEEQKHPEAAIEHYKQVAAGEQLLPARGRAAQLYLQQGKLEEARKIIRETPTRNAQEKTQALLSEAQLLRDAKRPEEAFSLLDAALKKQPDNVDFLYDAALLAERLGKLDVLESLLRRVLAIKPDHAHALNALGYSLADRNLRLPEARELIEKASKLAPEDPFIMDSLGWVVFRQGNGEEALKILEKAYALKADPEIAAHLGEVQWSLGRQADARKTWQEAARQNPDNETLDATIKKYQR